jgi:superfamily II DNA/RNA helicase
MLSGQSLLVNAENGSGKTLAFLLPILNQLYTLRKPENTQSRFTMSKLNEAEMF